MAVTAAAASEEGLGLAAAMAVTAAAATEEGLGLAAAVTAISAIAMSSATNCGWWTSAAIAVASATAMTALVRVGRGCDREHGCAGCEKYPGQHRKNSFRTGKRSARCTVPTPKRVEPALYRNRLNLECRCYSGS